MARISVPFAAQYDARNQLTITTEKLVNWFAQGTRTHGKESFVLIQRPGLNLVETLSIGPHRGSYVHDGDMYVVSSNYVYKMDTTETFTVVGYLNSYTGRVGMASNGTELIIVDGTYGYLYNTNTATFTQITDADFVAAQQVVFIQGYFIVNKPGTGRFYISAQYDGTSWEALDFATAELDPDDLIALAVTHQELVLLGEHTTEFYFNSGNALFPFENNPGGAIDWGIAARWTVAKADNTLVWLAKTREGQISVVKATGFSPQVISNLALEQAILGYERIDDAYAFVTKGGEQSLFYVLTFPTGNATWVFDFSTNMWHQWSTYDVGRFNIATACYFNNKHYMGSHTDGKFYWFDKDSYADGDDPLIRTAVTSHVAHEQNEIFWHSYEILFDSGKGIVTGQGSDPQAMLRWSDDGGYQYSNSHMRPIGKIGEYRNRAIWRRLGKSRHRNYELTVSDPVQSTVIGAYAELSAGNN